MWLANVFLGLVLDVVYLVSRVIPCGLMKREKKTPRANSQECRLVREKALQRPLFVIQRARAVWAPSRKVFSERPKEGKDLVCVFVGKKMMVCVLVLCQVKKV